MDMVNRFLVTKTLEILEIDMKFISWLLLLCMTTNVFAQSIEHDLKSSIEEFQYSFTVEWDQKDEAALNAMVSVLNKDLLRLKEQGMTQEQLLSVLEAKSVSPEKFNQIKAKLLLSQSPNSVESITEILKSEMKDLGAQGASWNGNAQIGYTVAALALIGILVWAAIAWQNDKKEWNNSTCLTAEKYESCGEEFRCTAYSYSDDGYGGRSESCVGGVYEWVCHTKERCLEWAK